MQKHLWPAACEVSMHPMSVLVWLLRDIFSAYKRTRQEINCIKN